MQNQFDIQVPSFSSCTYSGYAFCSYCRPDFHMSDANTASTYMSASQNSPNYLPTLEQENPDYLPTLGRTLAPDWKMK